MEMAEMYLKQKKYRLAIEAYKETLATKQLNERGQSRNYFYLAQALAYDNRTDEALEAITKAINLDDDNEEFRYIEAWIYSHARRWDEAILKFEQLKEDFADKSNVVLLCQFSISNIYVQKGDIRKGEEILEKVMEVNPDNSQVNNDLGYLWADQGKNLEQAEKMIRKALAAEPENPSYLDSLGWVLFKLERYEEAVPPLEQATQRPMGSDATVWDHLGDTLLKLMRIEKAVEAWQTALEHSAEDAYTDTNLVERIKDKLKQQGASELPKPAEKGSP
jgi:tetratricopeptide (TPR) repeat protein